MKKLMIVFLVFIVCSGKSYGQSGNVGVGTTSPSTKLDVNGALTAREAAPITVAGNTATIPDLAYSQYRLTGSPATAFTITGPTTSNGTIALVAGARLILVNATTQPGALNGFTIEPASAQEFTYSNGNWVAIRNPGTALGLFAKSAGTQVFLGGAVINDWVVTTNNFGSSWNGSVFTVPAGMQGWYNLSAGFRIDDSYGGGLRTPHQHAIIQVNGVTILQGTAAISVTGGSVNGNAPGTGTANVSASYYLNAGDQVTVIGSHLSYLISNNASTSAPPQSLYTYISILKQ